MKLFLDSYGCTLNQADAEIIKGILKKHRFTSLLEADTVILNTCAVKGATQSRMVSRIKEYLALGKKVAVAGCLPKINRDILEQFPVSIVDTNCLARIPDALKSKKPIEFVSPAHANKLKMPFCPDGSLTGIVAISEGCLSRCAFCGTKNARGNLTSYPVSDIVARVRELVRHGKKEIYLTAQDTGCYGFDIGTDLVKLLRAILKIPGEHRIRVGMMNPDYAMKLAGLTDLFRDKRVYRFLHVPVQSGSDKVILEMNRRYASKQFEQLVAKFRREVKDIVISTDIIVGFPTETEADFKKTMALVRRVKTDIVNVSKFCSRPNTPAQRMRPLRTQTLKRRSVALSALCRGISLEQNKKYVGKELPCLVTEPDRRMARAHNFKQVFLDKDAAGAVTAEIIGASYGHLKGKIINTS